MCSNEWVGVSYHISVKDKTRLLLTFNQYPHDLWSKFIFLYRPSFPQYESSFNGISQLLNTIGKGEQNLLIDPISYLVTRPYIYSIWGEYQIQSVCLCMCVCLCFQRFLSDYRSPLLLDRSSSNLVNTHISILRKIQLKAFTIKTYSKTWLFGPNMVIWSYLKT